MTFSFNTIYVIESLPDGEMKTGYDIWHDQLQYMKVNHPKLDVFYKAVPSLKKWDDLMRDILDDVIQNGNIPILHIEVHGEENGKGLVFKNGELSGIEHVGEQLRKINIATGCNLMLTLGVCKGLNLLFDMHLDKPMPFIGAVGSFDEIYSEDILIRYTEFYDTLFKTFNVGEAYIRLMNSNTGFPPSYRFFPADEFYYKNYQEYINKQCTETALKQRALDTIATMSNPPVNRGERRRFMKLFVKEEQKNRLKYFKEHSEIFFMLDKFPENRERFDVPSSFAALKRKYEKRVFV